MIIYHQSFKNSKQIIMKKIALSICTLLFLFGNSCNNKEKNPYDTSKTLDLITGEFNSDYVELIITNNNSDVLKGCKLITIEMTRNGEKIGTVKKLCSGPWQQMQEQKINLNWDYYKKDNSQTGAGQYTFSINSEVPKYCN